MEEESNSIIVASFPKNNRQAICVGLSEYQGKKLIFIREFVPSLNGELTPTRNGISLSRERNKELIGGIKALESVISSEKQVARITKNTNEEIRIGVTLYQDNPLIQIRTYAAYGKSSEFTPTKKGVAMSVNLLPQLLESIEKLETAIAALN